MADGEKHKFTIHGTAFCHKPRSVQFTRWLHRVLPLGLQRAFRDGGSFRSVADGGAVAAAAAAALTHPRLLLRFLALERGKRDHRYGSHPRQVIELFEAVNPASRAGGERPGGGPGEGSGDGDGRQRKLMVFIHGGAWGSGSPWMYRLLADRLRSAGFTVALIGYRVYPDTGVAGQVDDVASAMRWLGDHMHLVFPSAGGRSSAAETKKPAVKPAVVGSMAGAGEAAHIAKAGGGEMAGEAPSTDGGAGAGEEKAAEMPAPFPVGGHRPPSPSPGEPSENGPGAFSEGLPHVFLAGHSSGAHIALLFLIQRALAQHGTEGASAAAAARERLASIGGEQSRERGHDCELGGARVRGGQEWGGALEVEGFVGLSGVYDVHRHYLFEAWRGVHEISPLKAANGGGVVSLLHHSHPRLLRWENLGRHVAVRRATKQVPGKSPQGTDREGEKAGDTWGGILAAEAAAVAEPSGDGAEARAGAGAGGRVGVGEGNGGGCPEEDGFGGRMPRALMIHSVMDATVPFVQTSVMAAALRAIGVPTVCRYLQDGDHFETIGQLMFQDNSDVEAAVLDFTTHEAARLGREQRLEGVVKGTPGTPPPFQSKL